jgi:IS5 family transposase
MGNPLDKISSVMDFDFFRKLLESKLLNSDKKNNAGAKPFDLVMMFKIMILQRYFELGDRQIKYQIIDRISLKQFLGLETSDKVPDEKTVLLFRERLTENSLIPQLFDLFIGFLSEKELILNEGKMIDASFTVVPKQRNSREENDKIKKGEEDGLWNDNKHKKSHKDIDARWKKKNNETFFGYKNQELYADSAYVGQKQDETIDKYELVNKVYEKGFRANPLSDEQKANNIIKSKTRARVEHIFGFMEQSMNGLCLKSVGIKRAIGIIGLINLTYNLFRYEQITRLNIKYC